MTPVASTFRLLVKIFEGQKMQSGFVAPAVRRSICSRSFWTASRFYRCSAGIIFVSLILLILLGIFVVGPARDGLNLKPAICTVKDSRYDGSESCNCGKYCTSSFRCLKIYVDYQPKGKTTNFTDVLLHDTVYEHNDYIKVRLKYYFTLTVNLSCI